MKSLALLLLLTASAGLAEEIPLTKPAILRADRRIVSLKAGTVVELISRDEKLLTIRYNKLTGTIPAASADGAATPRKEEAKPTAAKPSEPAPPRKAETTYGKAVEKARENAAKHEKNLVKPTDEVTAK